jgi:putative acetyltransferase
MVLTFHAGELDRADVEYLVELHYAELRAISPPDACHVLPAVGRAMLHHIVAEAKARGYRRLSLETGNTEPFAAALRLYASEGFQPWGPFGDYHDTPFSSFLTRHL